MKDSENKLESIKGCLNNLIKSKEKTNKVTEYVTIHETEKNNYSLLTTNRRCKLLDESLPNEQIIAKSWNSNQLNVHSEILIKYY